MLSDFISLIYPHLCLACGKTLYKHESSICTVCCYELPRTRYHLENDNPISRLFWGKVSIENATSFLLFRKGERVQRLIHQLKYRGKTEIGETLGSFFGQELEQASWFNRVDEIIPVPLHPSKKRKRGYNQSDFIAKGLADQSGKPWVQNVLYRKSANETQTKKNLYQRWQNVHSIFEVQTPATIRDKHLLLIDDVVTTGSTLEACAHAILQVPGTKVSIATLACPPTRA